MQEFVVRFKKTEIVQQLLESEIENGFLYGPFDEPPFKNYRVSPLGVVTGKYSGKKRLIFICPHPIMIPK